MLFAPPTEPNLPRFKALNEIGVAIANSLQNQAQPQDGVLTARVVGEFSAGKTRFLRELFGPLIPDPLFPISSLEPQTKLQLEITFGDTPQLSLIEKPADYSPAQWMESLSEFPDRDHLSISNADPYQHRLRLELNDPHLILSQGDGFSDDKSPKKLFIIDTPGWNSGDDEISEREASSILTGYHNLGLIYVSHAARVDGALNANRLRDFLKTLSDIDFLDKAKLICIITHCPRAEAHRCSSRFERMVNTMWTELGHEPDALELHVSCVDFSAMSDLDLTQFRADFWKNLLPNTEQTSATHSTDPWTRSIRQWPEAWDLKPLLINTHNVLQTSKKQLLQAKKNGQFVAGMNMYRLIGLDAKAIQQKVKSTWLRQLGVDSFNDIAASPTVSLPNEHPMFPWYQNYWQPNVKAVLIGVRQFFIQASKAIDGLGPHIDDLDIYWALMLEDAYTQAMHTTTHSFVILSEAALALTTQPHAEKRVATLLTLSLLQARYEDYYEIHAQDMAYTQSARE